MNRRFRLPRRHRSPSRLPASPAFRFRLTDDRNFLIFWSGQTFSVLGDAVALIALPLLVLEATDSVARMGQVTAVHGVGALLAGLVAGPIVDRVDRRRLMIQCDLGRLLCSALIPLGWWLLPEPLWLLYALAFVGAGFGMIFGVAYVTAVANLVDRDQILDANGKLQTTFALSYVLGPMLAGLLFGAFGAGALLVTAGAYGISAISLTFVRLRRAAAPRGGEAGRREGRAGRGTAAREWGGVAGGVSVSVWGAGVSGVDAAGGGVRFPGDGRAGPDHLPPEGGHGPERPGGRGDLRPRQRWRDPGRDSGDPDPAALGLWAGLGGRLHGPGADDHSDRPKRGRRDHRPHLPGLLLRRNGPRHDDDDPAAGTDPGPPAGPGDGGLLDRLPGAGSARRRPPDRDRGAGRGRSQPRGHRRGRDDDRRHRPRHPGRRPPPPPAGRRPRR